MSLLRPLPSSFALVALMAVLACGLTQAQPTPSVSPTVAKATPLSAAQIDALVARTMKALDVPGIAVAVIKDGQTVVAKGYGVRGLNDPAPMDADTLAAIGSNTKAFTAFALGMLADENKLKWDDKVTDFIPEFKLYNPYVTDEFTIRDLLTHRSGLGLGAGDLMFWPGRTDFTTRDVIHNLRYLKQASGFRTRYDYDNLLYVVAGEVLKRASGMPYENFIEQRMLAPLGMRRSAASLQRLKDTSNIVTPHAGVDGRVQPVAWQPNEVVNAAGGIYSNVNDMSKWVGMLLAQGKFGAAGRRLFSEAVLQEAWRPQTPIGMSGGDYRIHFAAYGLGWFLSDAAGYKVVEHTGGVLGMVSQVVLVPELQLGIVVLTNQEQGAALGAIVDSIKDGYFGLPATDRVRQTADRVAARKAADDKQTAAIWTAIDAERSAGGKREAELTHYAGTYRDRWFGDVTVALEGGALRLRAQRSPALDGTLSFYKGTTFIVKWQDRSLNADAFVNFAFGPDGIPSGFTMKAVSPQTDFSYDFHDLDLRRVTR